MSLNNPETSFLVDLMNIKSPEQPKCKCGTTNGLCFRDNRWWCFDCVWAIVEKQQLLLESKNDIQNCIDKS